MFNTEIYPSTFIYIIILLLLMFIVLVKLSYSKKDNFYHVKFLALIISGIIYNVVEGLLPDKNFKIDIIAQNIVAFSIGLIVGFYYLYFIIEEYSISFYYKISFSTIAIVALIALIVLFILPYTITKSVSYSRVFFLSFFSIIMCLLLILVIKNSYGKIRDEKLTVFKLHYLIGIISFLFLLSLPFTILIFGDNQLIEQTFFSLGFFTLSIDYFLFGIRKTAIKKKINFLNLTSRETEILKILLENPEMKYSQISDRLNISEKTLSTHLNSIYKKTGIKNKNELKEMHQSLKNSIIF